MKKLILPLLILTFFMLNGFSQSSTEIKLYNPMDDAKSEIAKAVQLAKKEGKHVFLQLGGNWCGWCILFDKKIMANDTLKSAMKKNYVVYHVNYSKENYNKEVFASLGFPQRFGFPVFVILDGDGNRLHTQNSEYLEEGKGHNTKKTLQFLKHWSPTAVNASQYQN